MKQSKMKNPKSRPNIRSFAIAQDDGFSIAQMLVLASPQDDGFSIA